MNALFRPQVLGAGFLLMAAGALALYDQPDLEQKWAYMAPGHASRLEYREVYNDPAELLHPRRTAATGN